MSSSCVLLQARDPVLNGQELFGLLVGDVDSKLFFYGHRDLDQIERVGTEAVQASVRRYFLGVAAKVFNQDGGEFAGDVGGVHGG